MKHNANITAVRGELGLAGLPERPLFPPGTLTVPERVELENAEDGPVLVDAGADWETEVPDDLLLRFASLAEGSDREIVTFARTYGLLGLCVHGLPSSHNPPPYPRGARGGGFRATIRSFLADDDLDPVWRIQTAIRLLDSYSDAELVNWCHPADREFVEDWRLFAAGAAALLTIAGRLHQDRLPPLSAWEDVYGRSEIDPSRWRTPRKVSSERSRLVRVVGEWIRLGNVRPVPTWGHGEPPGIDLRGSGLFAALARQLAFTIAGGGGFAFCHECSRFFVPARRRSPRRRAFCPDCREAGAPAKWAMRDKRARDRKETP